MSIGWMWQLVLGPSPADKYSLVFEPPACHKQAHSAAEPFLPSSLPPFLPSFLPSLIFTGKRILFPTIINFYMNYALECCVQLIVE
jgi:hypothetical protein